MRLTRIRLVSGSFGQDVQGMRAELIARRKAETRLKRSDPSMWISLSGVLTLRELDISQGGDITQKVLLAAPGHNGLGILHQNGIGSGDSSCSSPSSSSLSPFKDFSTPKYFAKAAGLVGGRGDGSGRRRDYSCSSSVITKAAMSKREQRMARIKNMVDRQQRRQSQSESEREGAREGQIFARSASSLLSSSSGNGPEGAAGEIPQSQHIHKDGVVEVSFPSPASGDIVISLKTRGGAVDKLGSGDTCIEDTLGAVGSISVGVRTPEGRWARVGGMAQSIGRLNLDYNDPVTGRIVLRSLAGALAERVMLAQQHNAEVEAYIKFLGERRSSSDTTRGSGGLRRDSTNGGVAGGTFDSLEKGRSDLKHPPAPPPLHMLLLPTDHHRKEYWFGDRLEVATMQYNVFQ